MRGHAKGSNPSAQIKPSIVTNVQGIVKVTTAYWSIAIGEGGLGDKQFNSCLALALDALKCRDVAYNVSTRVRGEKYFI